MHSNLNTFKAGREKSKEQSSAEDSQSKLQPGVLSIGLFDMQEKEARRESRHGTLDDLFANWRPDVSCEKIRTRPIAPGFSGMLVHRVDVKEPKETFFCKSLDYRPTAEWKDSVWHEDGNACKFLYKEARNAEQAGLLGLGPKLRFSDPKKQFFLTDWIEGETLSSNDGRSERVLALVVRNIEKLRIADFNLELDSGLDHWLNRVSVKEFAAEDSEGLFFSRKFFDAHELIAEYLEGMPKIKVGWVHSDLKPANILQDKEGKLFFVDWCHLARGCPMNALAYYAVSTDIATACTDLLEKVFRIHAPEYPFDQKRLKLEMAKADIKSYLFFSGQKKKDHQNIEHFFQRATASLSAISDLLNHSSIASLAA